MPFYSDSLNIFFGVVFAIIILTSLHYLIQIFKMDGSLKSFFSTKMSYIYLLILLIYFYNFNLKSLLGGSFWLMIWILSTYGEMKKKEKSKIIDDDQILDSGEFGQKK